MKNAAINIPMKGTQLLIRENPSLSTPINEIHPMQSRIEITSVSRFTPSDRFAIGISPLRCAIPALKMTFFKIPHLPPSPEISRFMRWYKIT
jgi:hypothetical protein